MLSQEIRKKFLTYFKKREHVIVPSSPTVPHDDPTLLFINAGMNQFKDVFLGKSQRDYKRATSTQKCIRVGGKHNDLDNVGHTSRHMTFFEMLGNFSFGDYFKKEAIAYAWEVSTEIFQFDPERIWVSVFETDDETFELWKPYIDEKRIIRLGEEENFWTMGESGPCGPCTELLYDRGEKFGPAKNPFEDKSGERYSEFWNLVFMQYNRASDGVMTPLPKPCVDTGAGLERIVSFMMDTKSLFQTDVMVALIERVEELSGKKYDADDPHLAPAFHVIADHIRSLAFAIADGAQPSNVDRGYVLRKILRRAVRYGRLLGLNRPFLADVLPRLVELMGGDFHELKSAKNQISEILTIEEEGFLRTLKRGGNILNTIIQEAEKSSRKEISGKDAFKLKDTYGFPLEEILLIAKDSDLTVNLDAYEILDSEARDRSRRASERAIQEVESSLFE
nr:Alanine--tRNA ligase [Chlamydiota bacterium]